MRSSLAVLLSASLLLAACGSSLNPMNWFGGSTEELVASTPEAQAARDPRPLVDQVTELGVDRVPGGAIVHATGLPSRQGFWNAALVAQSGGPDKSGVLIYQFRIFPPLTTTLQGTPPSREVTAALFLSGQDLEGVRTIVVRGASNQRSARR
jgi:hypothetical protein